MIDPVRDFLNEHPEIDAILFGNNRLSIFGLKVLRELNKQVPEDVALISFDDYEFFELYNPSITAIAQPIGDIADNVINILLRRLNTSIDEDSKEQITLPTTLMIRKSTE